MVRNLPSLFFLLLAFAAFSPAQRPQLIAQKSVEQLALELSGQYQVLASEAKDDLVKRGKESVPVLSSTVNHSDREVRVRAISALGQIKDSRANSLLIALLNDSDEWIVGTAAYSLSQIGGEDAREALFTLFEKCMQRECEYFGMIAEAVSELPDTRSVPSLLKLIEKDRDQADRKASFRYAVKALGKLGDKRAAVPIAMLLDPKIPYSESFDYLFLETLSKIKSRESSSYLIDYLVRLNERTRYHEWFLGDVNDPSFYQSSGAGNRQRTQDRTNFQVTISILESITGIKTIGKTPVEKFNFWIEQPR